MVMRIIQILLLPVAFVWLCVMTVPFLLAGFVLFRLGLWLFKCGLWFKNGNFEGLEEATEWLYSGDRWFCKVLCWPVEFYIDGPFFPRLTEGLKR